jgi:hypothetical protein
MNVKRIYVLNSAISKQTSMQRLNELQLVSHNFRFENKYAYGNVTYKRGFLSKGE